MSAAVAKKGEDPTKAPVDRLQDESMNYLQHHKLEDAVCDALVKVVNERAANPRERMAQLLLGSKEGGGTLPMSKQATEKYEKQIADLQSENRRLKEELEGNRVHAHEQADQITKLTATNKENIETIKKHEERAVQLEQWLADAKPDPAKASSPAPPPAALPSAKATPKPAAAAKPATPAMPDARSVMATLFKLLQPTASGVITQIRVEALAATFEAASKHKSDESENIAKAAFIQVLRAMAASAPSSGASGKGGYRKEEWLESYVRAEGAYMGQQAATAMENLSAILELEDARDGLLSTVNEEEKLIGGGEQAYSVMMERLFNKVLKQGQDGDKVTSDRINKFKDMMQEAAESEQESQANRAAIKAAISAFVPVLERLSKTGKTYTEDEWMADKPESRAFTVDERETLVKELISTLKDDGAVEGMISDLKDDGAVEG